MRLCAMSKVNIYGTYFGRHFFQVIIFCATDVLNFVKKNSKENYVRGK